MKRAPPSYLEQEPRELDLTPMLDVVFILLIFFVVTATFVRETGLDVNRDPSATPSPQPMAALILIADNGELSIGGRAVRATALQFEIARLHAEEPSQAIVVVPSARSHADRLVAVMDAARRAGVDVSVGSF